MVVVPCVGLWRKIEVWKKDVVVEGQIEIEAYGVVGYECWLEWRAVDSTGGSVA